MAGPNVISIEKKEQCVQWFTKFKSVTLVRREYRRVYGENPPTMNSIRYWDKQYKETGSLERRKTCGKPYLSDETVDAILEHYSKNPDTSLRRASMELGISPATVHKVLKTNSGEKPYQCSHCGKDFAQRGNLEQHLKIHIGKKPYQCSHCGICFAYKSHLATHEKVHTGNRTFKCSHCDKCFIQKGLLTVHQRIHTGEKPYKCSICDKCFSRKDKLIEHQRLHTGEKPYQCDHCGKRFANGGNMQKHWITHKLLA